MLENVIAAAVSALTDAGLSAGAAFCKAPVDRDAAFLRVGAAGAVDRSAGFGRYLGVENDPETGEREVYGLRCEIELSLDAYAPLSADNAALQSAALFDNAAAVIGGVPGLSVREVRCGAPRPDQDTGMFRLSGAVKCAALLVSSPEDGEETAFTDFVLRGDLRNT